jgi:hypothetical protein
MDRKTRDQYAMMCARCVVRTPELRSNHLMPGETCKRDGYVDPRPKDWKPIKRAG